MAPNAMNKNLIVRCSLNVGQKESLGPKENNMKDNTQTEEYKETMELYWSVLQSVVLAVQQLLHFHRHSG